MDEVQRAKLIGTQQRNGMYQVDYSLKKPQEPARTLTELVGQSFNGTYNRLFTLTLQAVDEDLDKYGNDIAKLKDSFHVPASAK